MIPTAIHLTGLMTPFPLARIGLLSIGLILIGNLGIAYRGAAGLTLRAPIAWAAIALTAILTVELLMDEFTPRVMTWRYLAAVGTCCPTMALLGAKRPQDRGWQFVVGSLWIVLSLPALQATVLAPASQLDLHPAWRWFLLLLIGIGVGNHLPTRYAGSILLVGMAQLLLLQTHLPLPWTGSRQSATLGAVTLLLVAYIVGLASRRFSETGHTASNRVWLDFRDTFGAVWALRVIERVNQAANQADRVDRLHWRGFSGSWDPFRASDERDTDPLQVTIRMLLRRFVSTEWIERRCR